MNKIITTLIATLAIATTSFAKLGETLPQLQNRFKGSRHTTYVYKGETVHVFTNKNQVHITLRGGVSIMEIYYLSTPFNVETATEIADTVAPGHNWVEIKPTAGMAAQLVSDDGKLTVMFSNTFYQHYDNYAWNMAVSYYSGAPRQPVRQPVPQQQVQREQPAPAATPDRRDCAVVAAELLARLKPTTAWARVIAYHHAEETNGSMSEAGHAEVAFKYEADGHVFITDSGGTIELETTSEDIGVISAVFQQKIEAAGLHVKLTELKFLTK